MMYYEYLRNYKLNFFIKYTFIFAKVLFIYQVCYNSFMKKFNTAPISGMQELLPSMQAEFNHLKMGIMEAFAKHGFQSIETPTIERTEVLLAKAGGDTEKQIYKVVKTAETADDADQALRFDHTVPLARYMVEHTNDLTFPFKVTQVGRNFRGERAQKGRFREFYQCDVDIIGWQKLPIAYDAEIIATLIDALKVLPISKFVVRVSNRKLLSGLLNELNLQHQATEVFSIIDHAEKVPEEVTIQTLRDLAIGDENIERLTKFYKINGEPESAIQKLRELRITNAIFEEGLTELEEVLRLLQEKNSERFAVVADMLIVRGLDYYTGTVFETIAPDYREIGSVCSGGRYENLVQNYTEQPLPGVGGSIGLTRLFYILREKGLVKETELKPVDVCVIPITEAEFVAANRLADDLRKKDYKVDVAMTDKKLGDKMKYASKVASYGIVVGEEEAKTRKYKIKNFSTGETKEL